jgi:hypothetical protein
MATREDLTSFICLGVMIVGIAVLGWGLAALVQTETTFHARLVVPRKLPRPLMLTGLGSDHWRSNLGPKRSY